MSLPRDGSGPPRALARFTPDSRRWRRRVAGLAAVGGPLALYAAFAVASGVKTGLVYNLLILLFVILTLVLPAVAAATLLAPDSGLTQKDQSSSGDALETLKQRYAAGEIDHEEFDQRLDDLIRISGDSLDRRKSDSNIDQSAGGKELEPVGK